MSKKPKNALKGLESLGAALVEVEESTIAAAVEALASEPAFLNYLQAQEKIEKAVKANLEAQRLEKEIEARKSALGDIVIKIQSIQNRLGAFVISLREGLKKAAGITAARAEWGDNFKSMLERAVSVGVSRSANYASMQQELAQLEEEAMAVRIANEEAAERVKTNREMYERLTKEAGDLLASIEGGA